MTRRRAMPTFAPGIGDYDAIRRRLIRRAETAEIAGPDGLNRPLSTFNFAASRDIGVGLLHSWATIGDILSFYEQRLRDEGYLGDARDQLSLSLLADMVGYAPEFLTPSRTYLSYSLAATNPAGHPVTIPAGPSTQVLSVPQTGAAPTTFENAKTLIAHAGWNDLELIGETRTTPQTISNGALEARVTGAAPSLHVGGQIALSIEGAVFLRKIAKVERSVREGWTRVSWAAPLKLDDARSHRLEAVYSFKQRAALFGARAGDWRKTPDAVRARFGQHEGGVLTQATGPRATAHVLGSGLPYAAARALTRCNGGLLAATAKGVYQLVDGVWSKSPTLPPNFGAYSLHTAANGDLFAGGSRGSVLISTDQGASWRSLSDKLRVKPPNNLITRWILKLLEAVLKIKPKTPKSPPPKAKTLKIDGPVKAIATYVDTDGDQIILIGTDQGVFRKRQGDEGWRPFGNGLPGNDATTGFAQTPVNGLCMVHKDGGETTVLAATDRGLFVSGAEQADWRLHKLGDGTKQPKVHCVASLSSEAFAGADDGLYVFRRGEGWSNVGYAGLKGRTVLSLAADDHAGPRGQPIIVAATARPDPDKKDSDRNFVAFARRAGGWAPLAKRRRTVFVAPGDFSGELAGKKPGAALGALFAAKGRTLPKGATIVPGHDPSHWRIVIYEDRIETTLYHLRTRDGRLHVVSEFARSAQPISAIAFGPEGDIVTAAEPGSFLDQTWPRYEIRRPALALDRAVKGLVKGSVIALSDGDHVGLYPVREVENRPVNRFNRKGVVTAALIDGDDRLGLYDLRNTSVHFQSQALTPYARRDPATPALFGEALSADVDAAAIEADRLGAVCGAPATATLATPGGVGLAALNAPRLLPGLDVAAISATEQGLAIGTADGDVYLDRSEDAAQESSPDGWRRAMSLKAPVTALSEWRDHLVAATVDGEVVAYHQGKLIPLASGLNGVAVQTFLRSPNGQLFAAAGADAYWLENSARGWRLIASSGEGGAIRGLAFDPAGRLYAACARGLRRLTDDEDPPANEALAAPFDAHAIAFDADGQVFLGVPGDVVTFYGGEWRHLDCPAEGGVVRTLVFDGDGALWAGGAGVSPVSFKDGCWRDGANRAASDVTDMIATRNGVFAAFGARVWLRDDAGRAKVLNEHVAGSGSPALLDGAAEGFISQGLSAFMLNLGCKLDPTASLSAGCGPDEYLLRSGDTAFRLLRRRKKGDVAIISAPLLTPLARRGGFQVRDADGYHVTAATHEVTLGSAVSGAEPVAEIVRVASAAQSGRGATLRLTAPLTNVYDLQSARLSLNVAPAIEGQTIKAEPLTPMDADKRRYAITRGPVLAGTGGAASSITASVGAADGMQLALAAPAAEQPVAAKWREVADLQDCGPAAQVFSATPRADGAVLTFGDGEHGAHPPDQSGVSASWRVRTGPDSEAPAGAVKVFRNRPPGVKSVTNPIPAADGGRPVVDDDLRMGVIRSLEMTDRLVSLGDYQTAAAAFPGVEAALALTAQTEGLNPVHISVLARRGSAVDTAAVLAALNAIRADRAALTVSAARIVRFSVRIRLTLAPSRDFGGAVSDGLAAIERFFSGAGAGVGGDVDQALLISLVATVPGVAGVRVDLLHRTEDAAARHRTLRAKRPIWRAEAQRWSAGEVLKPSPNRGVIIEEEGPNYG